jgi:hypothetical protein
MDIAVGTFDVAAGKLLELEIWCDSDRGFMIAAG